MDLNKKFWEETYRRNINKMIGICFRYVPDKQIAEDLSHDAFLTAMNKSNTFRGKGHFEAWLRKITVNTALQYLRESKAKKKSKYGLGIQESLNDDETMEKRRELTTQELLEAINKLPEHHRLVFNLYVIDKYTHKQIANKLDISEGTSKSHLARARKKLKEILCSKYQEKNTKNILFIFPFGFNKLDNYYKRLFSRFEIEPQNTSFFDNVNWNTVRTPFFKPSFHLNSFTIKTIGASVSIGAIGVVIFISSNIVKESENNSSINQSISLEKQDSITGKTDGSIVKIKDTVPKQAPVIVIKKRITKKTVIVKDTLTIIDSSNAL